jgi:hypothetical protein
MLHLLSQLDQIYRVWLSESERMNGDQDVLYIRENLIVLFKREYVWLDLDAHIGNDAVYRYRCRAFQSEDEARESCQRLAFEYEGKAHFAECRQYEYQTRLYLEAKRVIIGEAQEAKVKALYTKTMDVMEARADKIKVLLHFANFRPKEFRNELLIPNPDNHNEIELSWLEAVKHQYRAGAQFYRGLAVYSLARFPSIIEQGVLLASFYETIACERKANVLGYKKKMYYSSQSHERETYATEICVEAAKADKCQAYANWFRHRQEMEALQEVVQEVEEMLAKKEKLAKIKKLANTEIDQPIYLIVLKVVLHYFLPLPSALQDLRAQFSSCFPLRE